MDDIDLYTEMYLFNYKRVEYKNSKTTVKIDIYKQSLSERGHEDYICDDDCLMDFFNPNVDIIDREHTFIHT